jgi:hypothetical protein
MVDLSNVGALKTYTSALFKGSVSMIPTSKSASNPFKLVSIVIR